MKNLIVIVVTTIIASLFASCSTLTSTTYIKPNERFLLGNNEHGQFSVKLKNISENDLEVYRAPITGGTHSRLTVKPGQVINVDVEANTALIIDNKFNAEAAAELLVKGDVGLSMGYKNLELRIKN